MRIAVPIAFLAGLLIGLLVASEPGESRRARSRRVSPSIEGGSRAKVLRPGEAARLDGARTSVADSPTLPFGEWRQGRGTLVVAREEAAWSYPREIELARPSMGGGYLTTTADEEEGEFRLEVPAGVYRLEYYDGDKYVVRGVEVVAGETRRMRLADLPDLGPAPIPTGCGRLEVELLGAGGRAVGRCEVIVAGAGIEEEQTIGIDTQSDGRGSVDLRPGRYEVRVGSFVRELIVRAGETTACVCDHASAGEVRLPQQFPGRARLFRPASMDPDAEFALHIDDWRHRTIAFVAPGRYEYGLLLDGHEGEPWRAGVIDVAPGRITRLAPEVPRGAVALDVELVGKAEGEGPKSIRAVLHRREPDGLVHVSFAAKRDRESGLYRGRAVRLPPGRWTLSLRLDGKWQFVRNLDIAEEEIRLSLVR